MKRMFSGMLAAAVVAGISSYASAAVVFELDNYKTDETPPDGTSPWLIATFESNGANQVKLTLDATNMNSSNFVRSFHFNVVGGITLTISNPLTEDPANGAVGDAALSLGGSPVGSAPTFSYSIDPPISGGGRLNGGETVTWLLNGTGITEDSFLAFVTSDKEEFKNDDMYVAAKIQGLLNEGSVVIWDGDGDDGGGDIPEPASLGVLGLGAAALLTRRRK
jgi:hypothetical protein